MVQSFKKQLHLFIYTSLICVVVLTLHQVWAYTHLKRQIGKHAYAINYALRHVGPEGSYVGKIKDFHWNRMPDHQEDVQGLQPRFLISREVEPGVVEERWYCSYLFEIRGHSPTAYTPSPFPTWIDQS